MPSLLLVNHIYAFVTNHPGPICVGLGLYPVMLMYMPVPQQIGCCLSDLVYAIGLHVEQNDSCQPILEDCFFNSKARVE